MIPNFAIPKLTIHIFVILSNIIHNLSFLISQLIHTFAIPNDMIPNLVIPKDIILNFAISNFVIPNFAIPNYAIPRFKMPNLTLLSYYS